jgi:hypothetical protein
VLKECRPNSTGNFEASAKGEWAWFNISHESGNGLDAFMTVDGKTTKRRYATGEQSRMVGEGGVLLGVFDRQNDRMTIDIKGAEGDKYHLGACWVD